MEERGPSWAAHPDPAMEARLMHADPAVPLALLSDPALRHDLHARLRALDRLKTALPADPRILGSWLQAMLLGNRPLRAWQVTGRWPLDASTPIDSQLLAAQVAQAVGRSEEARIRFHDVLDREPHWVDALQKFVEFERADAVPARVADTLAQILTRGRTTYDREKAGFALSRLLARYEPQRAFALAAASQAMKHERLGPWDRAALIARLATDRALQALPCPEGPCRQVFIVGLPRSGTTLLASLLGAHPSVANLGEQMLLPALAASAPTQPWSGASASRRYLAAVADLADGAAVVVDKLPANAEHAGFALAHFPDALVIHLERGLDDCAASIHMHDFEGGHGYASDAVDLGGYSRDIHDHLDALRERAEGRVMHLRFEDLARSPESSLRPVLAQLGLDWDRSIPDFWRQDVQTATYSEAQVREPVHTRSIGSARRFLPAADEFLAAVRASFAAQWHHPRSTPAEPRSP